MPASGTVSRAALTLARTRAFTGLLDTLERVDQRKAPRLTVLMYHRIADAPHTDLDPALLSGTPEELDEQMAYIAARRRVLSLAELLRVRRGEMPLPAGAVAVTFDDAYRDFGTHAWPILRRHGVPVMLFVPTAYPDRPGRSFWWDRLYHMVRATPRRAPVPTPVGTLPLASPDDRATTHQALLEWVKATPHAEAMAALDTLAERLETDEQPGVVMGWEELRSLAADGVDLAPHTRTHPMLDRVPLAEAQEEVRGSVRDLERETGASPPAFAFPAGGLSDELVAWLPEAGIEVAFATARGTNDMRSPDWLRLRRINVGRRSPLPVVRAQMLSWSRAAAA